MTPLSVLIKLNALVPAPGLARNIAEPVDVKCVSLEGREWTWTGSNVALVRVPSARSVKAHIQELRALWARDGLRPVRADEFVQLYEHAQHWPSDWPEYMAGGRIFFAGTVYTLQYSDESFERIFATRYDHEVQDWVIECEDTYVALAPGDRFACILDDPAQTVDGWMFKRSRSYERRSLYRAEDRPRLIRHRRASM